MVINKCISYFHSLEKSLIENVGPHLDIKPKYFVIILVKPRLAGANNQHFINISFAKGSLWKK